MKTIILFYIALLILSFLLGRSSVCRMLDTKKDTVTITRIDTIIKERVVPNRVVVDRFVYDTLNTRDSIFVEVVVPISKYIYEDSLYRAEISGYEVELEKIELFSRSHTQRIPEKVYVAPKRFGLGLQVGYGLGKGGAYPYIGVGLSYNILIF